jgi:hypothetical protein
MFDVGGERFASTSVATGYWIARHSNRNIAPLHVSTRPVATARGSDFRVAARLALSSMKVTHNQLMPKVDMSSKAITTRLKRVSQLRRLCLSLGTAKIHAVATEKRVKRQEEGVVRPHKREAK